MIGLKAWMWLAAWMIGAMWCFGQPGIYGGGRADSVMRCETDDFLRNMPPGLRRVGEGCQDGCCRQQRRT